MNYGKIKLDDFKARPDRMVYILREGKYDRFVILNNDSDMTERSEIHSQKTRRHITVARLIDKKIEEKMNLCPGLRGATGSLFKGLAYPRFFDDGFSVAERCVKEVKQKKVFSQYPELYPSAGRIHDSYDSYTTSCEIPIDDKPSDIAKLFSPAILQQLERFTVPQTMAERIREYVKIHGKS